MSWMSLAFHLANATTSCSLPSGLLQDAEAVHAADPTGHRVQLLRELLAWDPARRNVSAAVAGYNQLAATLEALMVGLATKGLPSLAKPVTGARYPAIRHPVRDACLTMESYETQATAKRARAC